MRIKTGKEIAQNSVQREVYADRDKLFWEGIKILK